MVDVKNIQLGAPIEYDYLGIKRRMDLIIPIVATDYLMPPLDKVRNKNIRKFFRYLLFRLEKTSFRFFGVSIFIFSRKN